MMAPQAPQGTSPKRNRTALFFRCKDKACNEQQPIQFRLLDQRIKKTLGLLPSIGHKSSHVPWSSSQHTRRAYNLTEIEIGLQLEECEAHQAEQWTSTIHIETTLWLTRYPSMVASRVTVRLTAA